MRPLLMMSGLIGTGKSTLASKISASFENYFVLSSSQQRRNMGIRKYRRSDSVRVRNELLSEARKLIRDNKGVIFDVTHHLYEGRTPKYEFAEEVGLDVVIIETICPQKLAIQRIKERKEIDDSFVDTNDSNQYLRTLSEREPIEPDLEFHPNLGYIKFNTEKQEWEQVRVPKKLCEFIEKLKRTT